MVKRVSARNLGLWLGLGLPGPNNDITDVPGVLVGHVSLIRGHGKLIPGQGPIRTGVTAILPARKNPYEDPCWAGIDPFNGYGKSMGVPFIQETGLLNTPILLTNTLSVPDVANGVMSTLLQLNPAIGNDWRTANLVVLECDDSYLNDIRGRHVKPADAILAIRRAAAGPIEQGNAGAGVGMSCFQFKGGIGSSSRLIRYKDGREFVLGVLVLANFGVMRDLLIEGIPAGAILQEENGDYLPGSLIIIGMTDAPLSRWQLSKLAKRAVLGQARTGAVSMVGSGDFCLVASTYPRLGDETLPDWEMDSFYRALIEATAESIWNALFLTQTLDGRDGHVRYALPTDKVMDIIRKWPRRFPQTFNF